jgi:hypothetical protein
MNSFAVLRCILPLTSARCCLAQEVTDSAVTAASPFTEAGKAQICAGIRRSMEPASRDPALLVPLDQCW